MTESIWRGKIKAITVYGEVSRVRIRDEERGNVILGCDTGSLSKFLEIFHSMFGKDGLSKHAVYYQVGELGSLQRIVPAEKADKEIAGEYEKQRNRRVKKMVVGVV